MINLSSRVTLFVTLLWPAFAWSQFEFTATDYSVGENPYQIANGDFNGDNATDLVVINFDSLELSILFNDGTGQFFPVPSIDLEFAQGEFITGNVTAGDFNNDGFDEIAVTQPYINNTFDGKLFIFTSNGDGTFNSPIEFELGEAPTTVVACDLDADGDKDLCVSNCESDQLAILINDDTGFLEPPTYIPTDENPGPIAIGDVNQDNHVDIVVSSVPTNFVCVFLGNGDGTFSSPDYFFVGGLVPIAIDLGDINGDQHDDLACVNVATSDITFLLNDGHGDFTFDFDNVLFLSTRSVRLLDIDFDAIPELLVHDRSCLLIHPGNGDTTFGDPQIFEVGAGPIDIVSADYNQDGKPDLVSASGVEDTITVFLQGAEILLGDVNLDGVVDLLDVQPFVNLLVTNEFQPEADINQDGNVDLLDVGPFIDLL